MTDEELVDALIEKANREGHVAEEYAYNTTMHAEASEDEKAARKAVLDRFLELRADLDRLVMERAGFEMACQSLREDRDARMRGELLNVRISLGGDIVIAERNLATFVVRTAADILTRDRMQKALIGMKARAAEMDLARGAEPKKL